MVEDRLQHDEWPHRLDLGDHATGASGDDTRRLPLPSQGLQSGSVDFIGAPAEKDPVVGSNDGSGMLTIPQRPIRRRLTELPPFVVTRGGEYCFAPGLRALRWLADLET
jgi:hypothetical protein